MTPIESNTANKNARLLSLTARILLFACAFLLLLFQFKTPFNYYDEGYELYPAIRILNGDVPYTDFWVIYPPGQFYAIAAVFKVFGVSLLVSRAYDTLVRLVIASSVWFIARKVSSHALAYVALITASLLLGSVGNFSYAVFPALALGLLSISGLLEYIQSGRRGWLLLAGALVGLTAFFRWDIGLYAGLSVLATAILLHRVHSGRETGTPGAVKSAAADIAVILGGTLGVVLMCYGYVGAQSGFGNLWYQVVSFPTTQNLAVRWLPYPPLLSPLLVPSMWNVSDIGSVHPQLVGWLEFYLPPAVYGLGLFSFMQAIMRKRGHLTSQLLGGIAVAVFGLLLFAQVLSRYDEIHATPTLLIMPLVVVALLTPHVLSAVRRPARWLLVLLLPLVVISCMLYPASALVTSLAHFPPLGCYSHLDRASCVPVRSDQERAVVYITKHTPAGERIFVGNRRHDLIFVNDIGFYFLSARASATRYAVLDPGLVTTLPVQQEIVRALESKNVKWIVLVDTPLSGEPNDSARSSGVTYLDDFIRASYSPTAEFGAYQILTATTR